MMAADQVTLYGQVRYCCAHVDAYVVGVCGEGIQINGSELTCSVEDLLAYWASISDTQEQTSTANQYGYH
jgi:hypothetical protein